MPTPIDVGTTVDDRFQVRRLLGENGTGPVCVAFDRRREEEVVLDLLAQFHQDGGTVLLVTHDPVAAERAQRVVHLRDGRVESDAPA